VLLEAGLGLGLLLCREDVFAPTRAGLVLLRDEMTRVNFNFVNDICRPGLPHLEASIRSGKPVGLKEFGPWPTIYEGLSTLPAKARENWLKFDHFYSDNAFEAALKLVLEYKPRSLLDIGGNTGRWALRVVGADAKIEVCIADLPGQCGMAEGALRGQSGAERISFFPVDILEVGSVLPEGFDALWMSQFLDCFSEEQILMILGKCRRAAHAQTRVFILEPFWDRQRFLAGAFILQMASLYFTALANGVSQFYRSDLFVGLVRAAGFEIEAQHDNLGIGHTLLVCRPA
jgi:hypothetical protein